MRSFHSCAQTTRLHKLKLKTGTEQQFFETPLNKNLPTFHPAIYIAYTYTLYGWRIEHLETNFNIVRAFTRSCSSVLDFSHVFLFKSAIQYFHFVPTNPGYDEYIERANRLCVLCAYEISIPISLSTFDIFAWVDVHTYTYTYGNSLC